MKRVYMQCPASRYSDDLMYYEDIKTLIFQPCSMCGKTTGHFKASFASHPGQHVDKDGGALIPINHLYWQRFIDVDRV